MAEADRHQREVIDLLRETGHQHIAERLHRCLLATRSRRDADPSSWPWRCRNAGCWSCRRTLFAADWRTIFRIGAGGKVGSTIVSVPLEHEAGNLRQKVRSLRRAIRDLRDRWRRHDRRWNYVGFRGLAATEGATLLVQHAGLDAYAVEAVLNRRWPTAVLRFRAETSFTAPEALLSAVDAAALAVMGRGIEPVRIRIGGQRQVRRGTLRQRGRPGWSDPMPMVLG